MRLKSFALLLFVFIVSLYTFSPTVSANNFRTKESVTIPSKETIDGSAYVTGNSVDVAGTIDGDLYCAGQNINISGEVTGDVLCIGQTITISGTIVGDVRLTGQSISLSGEINKSASFAGQTITLSRDGQINQDATIVGQNTYIYSNVGRDLVVSSTTTNIDSSIGRNVNVDSEKLQLGNNATIGGTLEYASPQKLASSDGSKVAGDIVYTEVDDSSENNEMSFYFIPIFIWPLILLLSALLFALIFPRVLRKTVYTSMGSVSQVLLTVLIGFAACIVVPITSLLLMFTVIFIPLAIVLIFAWMVVLALSYIFSAYFIGRSIWRDQTNILLTTIVGTIIIIVLLLIPIINIITALLCTWYGSGAIVLLLKKHTPVPSYSENTSPVKAGSEKSTQKLLNDHNSLTSAGRKRKKDK